MGCECCKIDSPSTYALCEERTSKLCKEHKMGTSPCGQPIGLGSNYTPPKPKKKRKKKAANGRRKR